MKTTASIVTYLTDSQELSLCVKSLLADGIDMVYIVDNSPGREIESLLHGNNAVTYIHNGKNLGYGTAHNIAIRRAMELGVEYHLVINSDVRFGHDTLGPIIRYMDANPGTGQLIPNMVYPDGSLQHSVRLLPTPADLILRRFLPDVLSRKLDNRYMLRFWNHSTPLDIPYHQGSFMFFRMSALKEVGLFDERFFMYPEDIDITRRMHRRYRTMFWPEVTVVHDHRAASYHSFRMLCIHMINMVRYFNKWGWFFDSERRRLNRATLDTISRLKD